MVCCQNSTSLTHPGVWGFIRRPVFWAQPTDSRGDWDLGTGWATPADWCCCPQTMPWWLWQCVWDHCPAGRQSPSKSKASMLTAGNSPEESPYTVQYSRSPWSRQDGLGLGQRSISTAWHCRHHAWLWGWHEAWRPPLSGARPFWWCSDLLVQLQSHLTGSSSSSPP